MLTEPRFAAVRKLVGIGVEKLVFMSMAQGVLKVALANRLDGDARLQGNADVLLNALQEAAQDIVPVSKAAVNRWSVGPGCAGHGAHGERLFGALLPQPLRGIQNSRL